MIRILILLLTLNAAFPTAGFACVCAAKMSAALSTSNMQSLSDDATNLNATTTMQMHCDNSLNMNMAMSCDSGCCASCVTVSVVLATPSSLLLPLIPSTKPVSGYINFHTRYISPELQPPLV